MTAGTHEAIRGTRVFPFSTPPSASSLETVAGKACIACDGAERIEIWRLPPFPEALSAAGFYAATDGTAYSTCGTTSRLQSEAADCETKREAPLTLRTTPLLARACSFMTSAKGHEGLGIESARGEWPPCSAVGLRPGSSVVVNRRQGESNWGQGGSGFGDRTEHMLGRGKARAGCRG